MVAPGVDYTVIFRKTYKPGDEVEASGVYKVIHDSAKEHEVTIVHGAHFPACRHCGMHPRFVAVKLAQHVESNEHFATLVAHPHHR